MRMCGLRRLQRSDTQEERVGVEMALLADTAVALKELSPRAPLRRMHEEALRFMVYHVAYHTVQSVWHRACDAAHEKAAAHASLQNGESGCGACSATQWTQCGCPSESAKCCVHSRGAAPWNV